MDKASIASHSDLDKSDVHASSRSLRSVSTQPSVSPSIEQDYPMGRWRAWSTVVGAWMILSCSVGMTSAFGVFQDYYTSTYMSNYSASTISWIGGVQIFLELILGPIGGWLNDHGYIRAANIAGCSLFTLCFFLLSLANPNQYYQAFLAQGVGMGAGIGILYIPASTVVFKHFKTRRALATGLVDSGTAIGGIFLSIILNTLIHSSLGFAWAVRICAFVTLFFFIVGNFLVFIPPPTMAQPASPSDSEPDEKSTVPSNAEVPPKHSLRSDIPYFLLIIWGFVASLGMYFPAFYIQLFARTHGIAGNLSFYSLAFMNAASVFGRVLPNWAADRWGKLEVFLPCATIGGLAGFAMLGSTTPAGLVIFVLCYGFFFGASVALYLPIIDILTPAHLRGENGMRMGMAIVPVGIACLVGPPICGAVLGANYEWWKGVLFASITDTVPCVCLAAALYLHRRGLSSKNQRSETESQA